MRAALSLLILMVAFSPAALAQTSPDSSIVSERVRRAERPPSALGVQILTGSLGATAGLIGGAYLGGTAGGGDLDAIGTALLGAFVGTALGATIGVQTTGRKDRFWETMGGSALGAIVGVAVVSALGDAGLSGSEGLAIPIGAGIGGAIGNSVFGD